MSTSAPTTARSARPRRTASHAARTAIGATLHTLAGKGKLTPQAADDAERERARSEAAAAENATTTGAERATETTANAGEGRGGDGSAPPGSEPSGNAPADADAPSSDSPVDASPPDADAELMRALEMSMAEEEEVDEDEDGDGEEPPESPPPRAKKRHVAADDVPLPTPSRLLPTILHLAVRNEAMLHPGAKLLTREIESADRSERVATVSVLSQTISAQFAQLREGDADETHAARLRAAVHLLTLLLVVDPIATRDMAEEGLADVVLGHLETFLTAREASGGDAATTKELARDDGDGEAMTSIAMDSKASKVFCASRNGRVVRYDVVVESASTSGGDDVSALKRGKTWNPHKSSPVLDMSVDSTGTLLCTGSADRTARVWDIERGYCTHAFRGKHGGAVTATAFHPSPSVAHAYTAADDGSIAVWSLNARAGTKKKKNDNSRDERKRRKTATKVWRNVELYEADG